MNFEVHPYVGFSQIAGYENRRFAYKWGPSLLAVVATDPASQWDNKTDCVIVRGVDAAKPGDWMVPAPLLPEFPLRWTVAGNAGLVVLPYFAIQHNETFSVYPVVTTEKKAEEPDDEEPSKDIAASTNFTLVGLGR